MPLVLHDPDGLLVLEDDDEAELATQRGQAVEQAVARRRIAVWLVERAEAQLPRPAGYVDSPTSSPQELLAVRSRAAFAWQDEVLRQLT